MSVLFRQALETATLGWVSGLMTIFFLALFLGWAIWAFLPSNRDAMDEMARMPLDDGGEA